MNAERVFKENIFLGIVHEAKGAWYATVPASHRRLDYPTFRTDGNGLVRLPSKPNHCSDPLTWHTKEEAVAFLYNFHHMRTKEATQ